MPKNQKIKNRKRYGIWAWVGAIYGPIIFWVLFVNLPKIEWKYVFESNKTRVARHHQKAKDIGLPGICLLYTSPSPRDKHRSRMPSSA